MSRDAYISLLCLTIAIGAAACTVRDDVAVLGPGVKDTLTLAPSMLPADGSTEGVLTFTVSAGGAPIPRCTVQFLSNDPNIIVSGSTTTDAQGQAVGWVKSASPGVAVISVRLSGSVLANTNVIAQSTVAVQFFTPAAASNLAGSSLVISPTTLPADGSAYATVTVRTANAKGDAVPALPVHIAVTGTQNKLVQTQTATDINGMLGAQLSSTSPEIKTLTAVIDGNTLLQGSVTFASAPAFAQSQWSASPNHVVADGNAYATLTLKLSDSSGIPMAGEPVMLSSSMLAASIQPTQGITNNAGTFVATVRSTTAQNATIEAYAGTFTFITQVAFTAGAPVASRSTLTATPARGTPADGVSRALALAVLRDALGNPVPQQALTFTGINLGPDILSVGAITDAAGTASLPITSVFSGTKQITARTGGLTLNANVAFAAPPAYQTCNKTSFYGMPPMLLTQGVPKSMAVGKINGDTHLDVVTADQNGNTVSVGLGLGTGAFAASTAYTVGTSPGAVALCDVNHDNNLDVVTANANSFNFSVLLGAANGTFGTPINTNVGGTGSLEQTSIGCADFTGDGNIDIVLGTQTLRGVAVYPGNNDGTFGSGISTTAATYPWSLAIGDINGDGVSDVVYTNQSTALTVLNGNNLGTFRAPTYVTIPTGSTAGIALGDFNGDGRVDAATTSLANTGNVTVCLNTAGTLSPTSVLATSGGIIYSVATTDFNHDGRLDLTVASNRGGTTSVAIGNGDGTFATPTAYATDFSNFGVATGDINGDGNDDVVSLSSLNASVTTFLGDGDGTLQTYASTNITPNQLQRYTFNEPKWRVSRRPQRAYLSERFHNQSVRLPRRWCTGSGFLANRRRLSSHPQHR